ncbi:MAG: hypothetical protein ABSC56_10985 [Solirubrobacteraceae bacterium]|jgi:hypothetical protein
MAVAGSDSGLLVPLSLADEEALFREARRLRRRRWIRRTGVMVAVACVGSATIVLALSGGARTPRSGGETAGVLPNGPFESLKLAGAVAVAPDGAVYVAAGGMPGFTTTKADRVLVRLPDGRFRVVAGNGHHGFSGDGGQAVDAELSDVSDITFAPNGTMYIADGHRVRIVSLDGVIRTIAGNGRAIRDIIAGTPAGERLIANGTPALAAPLGFVNPLYIALDPRSGQLFISTGAGQILRLTRNGRLDTVRAIVPSGIGKGPFMGDGPLAIDKQGNIDITGGPRGWSAWQIAPDGIATYLGFARMPGGDNPIVQPGPNGAIYVGIDRVHNDRLVLDHTLESSTNETINGQYFPNAYFAFAPNGTLYVDDLPGGTGWEPHQQLRAISHGRATLLWQEPNHVPK